MNNAPIVQALLGIQALLVSSELHRIGAVDTAEYTNYLLRTKDAIKKAIENLSDGISGEE